MQLFSIDFGFYNCLDSDLGENFELTNITSY